MLNKTNGDANCILILCTVVSSHELAVPWFLLWCLGRDVSSMGRDEKPPSLILAIFSSFIVIPYTVALANGQLQSWWGISQPRRVFTGMTQGPRRSAEYESQDLMPTDIRCIQARFYLTCCTQCRHKSILYTYMVDHGALWQPWPVLMSA